MAAGRGAKPRLRAQPSPQRSREEEALHAYTSLPFDLLGGHVAHIKSRTAQIEICIPPAPNFFSLDTPRHADSRRSNLRWGWLLLDDPDPLTLGSQVTSLFFFSLDSSPNS